MLPNRVPNDFAKQSIALRTQTSLTAVIIL